MEKSLQILIKGNRDIAVLEDNATHKNRFEIKSETSNRLYIVAQSKKDNSWQCSCPGWIIKRGPERTCKHLRHLMPLIKQAGL